jgi:thiosulfate/3-mercaptopyruvate sulfurtransferase
MISDSGSALVGVGALADLLSDDSVVVLDVRWVVGSPPLLNDYVSAHIPGAQFCDLDAVLADPPGPRGRHPLPDPDRLQAQLRQWGVNDESTVVVYDGAASIAAARAWWVLRWAGLRAVLVLDGGFAAWSQAGEPIESGVARPVGSPGRVTVRPGSIPALDAAAAAALGDAGLLVDVRAPERYRGEIEPIDPVAGHIPGARNVPTTGTVTSSGSFKSVAGLRRYFAEAGLAPGGPPVGVYCGSGVTAAQTMLAMHEAGIDATLYPGSWSEWLTDPTRPVARG